MARQAKRTTSGKPVPDGPVRVKTTIHFEPEAHKLLQLASIESGQDMSDIVNAMIKERFAGWHIRRGRAGAGDAGQIFGQNTHDASGSDVLGHPGGHPTVRIPSVQNRLNDIARKAHGPIDDALDGLTNESA